MQYKTTKGARDSMVIYSLSETAKANDMKSCEYIKYLCSELLNRTDDDGNIDPFGFDGLLPWAEALREVC